MNLLLFFRSPSPAQTEWNNEINTFSPNLTPDVGLRSRKAREFATSLTLLAATIILLLARICLRKQLGWQKP